MLATYDDYFNNATAGKGRCGCLDSQFLGESRWAMRDLTFAFANYPVGAAISKDIVEGDVTKAFNNLAAVCGLSFTATTNTKTANVLISAARGKLNNFDGPGGVLAWCELPPGKAYTGQVNLCFDLDEAWDQQIPILNVACHEGGHGVGLSHTNVPRQLMNPYLSDISTPQDHDTMELVTLYGQKLTPVPQPGPTPTPTPTPGIWSPPKAMKLQGPDGSVWGATPKWVKVPANAMLEGMEWVF